MAKVIQLEKRGILKILANYRTPQQNAAIMDRHATHAAHRLDKDITDIIGHDKPRFYMPGVATPPGTFYAESAIASTWPDFGEMGADIAEQRALANEKDEEFRKTLARLSQPLKFDGVLPPDMHLDPQDVAEHEERQNVIRDMFGECDDHGKK